jgi:hypothetical protein
MRYRVTFIAGFATGFVAGARAGRERYDQIARLARQVADNAAVQQAAGALQAQASTFTVTARNKMSDRLHDRVPWLRADSDASANGAHAAAKGTGKGSRDGARAKR